ncbi:hypothetical protein Bpfe_006839 [Biomphalaria pfeifferi]|uniref:Uncharacterized protein n=1 Tax=Biomphalaria pfeifferi TaxID=112525 RepID=A0AAD8BZT8_BIOPF|nr:hypothetical protein Bpfe_006839 [Biomphalaria pfeifferi]
MDLGFKSQEPHYLATRPRCRTDKKNRHIVTVSRVKGTTRYNPGDTVSLNSNSLIVFNKTDNDLEPLNQQQSISQPTDDHLSEGHPPCPTNSRSQSIPGYG